MPSRFAPEPAFRHDQPARTAVLLCNLGTPDAPTAPAVRRYLAQFLWDDRVVEIPRLLWWPLLHGLILRTRPAKSAAKYATVWSETDGSPLMHWSRRQAVLLQQELEAQGLPVLVRHAMRYGQPAIASELDKLKAEGATRILILPLYPQYSGTTTASVMDAVYDWARTQRLIPELRFVNRYHDDAAYIDALAQRIEAHWASHGRAEQLVMSFHGVPERTLHLGDPYHCESHKTARLLAQRLGLDASQYQLTFQSRFGKAKWLEPYTEPTLIAMAQRGIKHVDVVCPGFTSDCLETLEEIQQEAQHAFLQAGGEQFRYIACLNDSAPWIDALAGVARQHLAGWPVAPDQAEALAATAARAQAAGAAS